MTAKRIKANGTDTLQLGNGQLSINQSTGEVTVGATGFSGTHTVNGIQLSTVGQVNAVYTSSSASLTAPSGTALVVRNNQTLTGSYAGISLSAVGGNTISHTFSIGVVSQSSGFSPEVVFTRRSGSTSYDEVGKIAPTLAWTLGGGSGSGTSGHTIQADAGQVVRIRNHNNNLRSDGLIISLINNNVGAGALSGTCFLRCFNDTAGETENSTERMVIRVDGNVYNANSVYGSTSDIALKTNIQTARNYLSDLRRLRPVTYNRLDSLEQKQLGLIAQEVEQVFPGLVEGEDGSKSVKYSIINIMLLKSVQELADKLDAAEARIKQLEDR